MHYDKQDDQSNLLLNRIPSLRVSVTVLLWRPKLLGGSTAFMLPQEFLDFNLPKSSFLGFWVIQTGYWPVPFSSDEALQIGGLFPEGQFPGSEYGARRVQAIFQISTWKFFFIKNIFITKNLTNFRFQWIWSKASPNRFPDFNGGSRCKSAYLPQRIFFKWNRSGSHCNRVGYHQKSWSSAFFWMFKPYEFMQRLKRVNHMVQGNIQKPNATQYRSTVTVKWTDQNAPMTFKSLRSH